MVNVVGISFRKAGKIYYFDTDGTEYSKGDYVIVETVRGLEIGRVVVGERSVPDPGPDQEIKKIVRPASQEDLVMQYKKRLLAHRALKICKKKIKEYELAMKLVDVEYSYDNTKIIFYFSADGRIDFRNLVRELAVIFKKRIELHQIGVRDEAKILGAVGLCGKPVCCSVYMPEFLPVSIKMAKEQNLSLNPERISGVCGRFMCCLRYEHEVYHEGIKAFPQPGAFVETPQGRLKVLEQRIAKGTVVFENSDQERVEFKISELPEYASAFRSEAAGQARPSGDGPDDAPSGGPASAGEPPAPSGGLEEEARKEIMSFGMMAESLLAPDNMRPEKPAEASPEASGAPALRRRRSQEARERGGSERPSGPDRRRERQERPRRESAPEAPAAEGTKRGKFRILPFEVSAPAPYRPEAKEERPAPARPSKKKIKIKIPGELLGSIAGSWNGSSDAGVAAADDGAGFEPVPEAPDREPAVEAGGASPEAAPDGSPDCSGGAADSAVEPEADRREPGGDRPRGGRRFQRRPPFRQHGVNEGEQGGREGRRFPRKDRGPRGDEGKIGS